MIPLNKKDLRAHFAAVRKELSPNDRQDASVAIAKQLLASPMWQQANTVLVYVSDENEVNTTPIIEQALAQGKKAVVPVFAAQSPVVELSELSSLKHLIPGHWPGIREPDPQFRKPVEPATIDLCLLPGVVFDRQGGRIGRGGGHYDRLLPLMPRAWYVALAFSSQISSETLPLETHDQRVHRIITEHALIDSGSPKA